MTSLVPLRCRQQRVDAAAAANGHNENLSGLLLQKKKHTTPLFPIRMMQIRLDMRQHDVRPLRVEAPWWPPLSITLRNKSIKSSRTNESECDRDDGAALAALADKSDMRQSHVGGLLLPGGGIKNSV